MFKTRGRNLATRAQVPKPVPASFSCCIFLRCLFHVASQMSTSFSTRFSLVSGRRAQQKRLFSESQMISWCKEVLLLLDLSSAADSVGHSMLVGGSDNGWISGSPLTFQTGHFQALFKTLSCGVPQGSVLGPVLFASYMLPLRQILGRNLNYASHLSFKLS